MTRLWRPLLTVAALVVLLTFLMLRGTGPDPRRSGEQLGLVDALVLDQAALEQAALEVRAGLLANYDPLVDAEARLRATTRQLGDILEDPVERRRLADLEAALRTQEAVVETIKSSNALVQKSLAYFAFLVQRQALDRGALDPALAGLTTDMLRFARGVDRASRDELGRELAGLEARSDGADPTQPERSIASHGRIIVESMPLLSDGLARLTSSPVNPAAAALRSLLVERDARLEWQAQIYRALLYAAAVLLLVHLALTYLRLGRSVADLGRKTADLEARSSNLAMLGRLSTSFIGLPPERIDGGIEEGLAMIGRQLGVDRAYLVTAAGEPGGPERVLAWPPREPSGAADPPAWPGGVLGILGVPEIAALERDGEIAIARVRDLPAASAARAALEARGVGAWLGIPLRQTGRLIGLLGLEVARDSRAWPEDCPDYLRLAADILAHVLERQRSEAERQALTGRLAQAERMEAIGALAGGIAHNFNNILGAILGYAEMGLASLPEGSRSRRHLEEVRRAGTRAKLLVDQILTFGRRSERCRTPVRIAPLLDETIRLLAAVLPATVTVEGRLLSPEAVVAGDPAQLQQIVMNLCTNAAQAMGGLGQVELAASLAELGEGRELSHGTLAAGRYVRVTVADRGHGMDRATLGRLFEPFFTTKLAGRGTGLGLATVHGIVTDHGGAVDVSSLPGEGTVFDVYLPAAASPPAAPAPTPPPRPTAPGAGQTILIVDDEESLVLLGEEMLASLGYEPVGVTDPVRALALFERDPARFDLLLSDEVMPGLTGNELAARVAARRPDLPILLMTGYGGLVAADRLRAPGIREVLRKPLLPSELAAAIARQLAPAG